MAAITRRHALAALVSTAAAGPLVPFASAVLGSPGADAIAAAIDADPCLAFVTAWNAAGDRVNAAPDGEVEAIYNGQCRPFEQACNAGAIPAPTTAAGAAAALRKVISIGDLERQDEVLVRAALSFLEGRA